MLWIRVTRIVPDSPTEHEAVLLNTAHILSMNRCVIPHTFFSEMGAILR
jgi:hypothetical protein